MQNSEEADLTRAAGVVLEALRMKAVSFHVLALFRKFFQNGNWTSSFESGKPNFSCRKGLPVQCHRHCETWWRGGVYRTFWRRVFRCEISLLALGIHFTVVKREFNLCWITPAPAQTVLCFPSMVQTCLWISFYIIPSSHRHCLTDIFILLYLLQWCGLWRSTLGKTFL